MSDDLEERLRSHARSFDSLLSLIPAKLYYGEDVSDQWKRKKQTPEQKRAAKMAKLDPSNWKSAKDVLDERSAAVKRKRESEAAFPDGDDSLVEPELPKSIQELDDPKPKKRKVDDTTKTQQGAATALTVEEKKLKKAEKKAAKKEKAQKEREKLQRQKARKQAEKAQKAQDAADNGDGTALSEPILLDQGHLQEDPDADSWSTASSDDAPEIFSPPAESGTSSISSLSASLPDRTPKIKTTQSKQKQKQKPQSQPPIPKIAQNLSEPGPAQPPIDHVAAKARLAEAISTFRSARKADEPTVNKPRNRAELLEQRRRKEEARREAKKEQRRKERDEQARKEDEEIARRFSPGGSGSLLASPRSPPTKDSDGANNNAFSYGRIEFSDGTQVDSTNMNGFLDARKKKGPQDAQTALKAAQNKASRISGLDEQKRKTIEEKDMWLNAKRRAHGDRVRDDTSLLKRALKRQEGQKKKSEKEWTERKDGVVKAQEARQKKRTENLAKRKEDKLAHKGGKKSKKIKKRPGFEGSFRGRTGGGGKKKTK